MFIKRKDSGIFIEETGQCSDQMWQEYGKQAGRNNLSYKIAIVEDQPDLRDNYADVFKDHGYQVSAYANRSAAETAFSEALPDLAVIDIGLGDEPEGGFSLCQWLRQRSNTVPIIFLSARDSDLDIVSGLRMGADDYVTKDMSLPHLLARVGALFRRIEILSKASAEQATAAEQSIQLGDLTLDDKRFTTHWQNQLIELTLTEFWMIHALVQNPGHVKKRQQLMQDAHIYVDDATITSHIKRIRRKFQKLDPQFDCIETVYGLGYRWRA
jgi:two-component system OmpR family response regulator